MDKYLKSLTQILKIVTVFSLDFMIRKKPHKKVILGIAVFFLFAFPVSGNWCEWSEWTPCSRTCGAESVSRYRSCGCPEPRAGGAACSGEQEIHNGIGVQIQRQPCPVITFCPGKTPAMTARDIYLKHLQRFWLKVSGLYFLSLTQLLVAFCSGRQIYCVSF